MRERRRSLLRLVTCRCTTGLEWFEYECAPGEPSHATRHHAGYRRTGLQRVVGIALAAFFTGSVMVADAGGHR